MHNYVYLLCILALATIQGWHLFHSELPILWLLFASGNYSKKYGYTHTHRDTYSQSRVLTWHGTVSPSVSPLYYMHIHTIHTYSCHIHVIYILYTNAVPQESGLQLSASQTGRRCCWEKCKRRRFQRLPLPR